MIHKHSQKVGKKHQEKVVKVDKKHQEKNLTFI